MKLVECQRCGSRELNEDGDHLICGYCQSRFLLDIDEVPALQTEIGVGTDIQNLLQKCRDDPPNRRRYAGLVLDLDPHNIEAMQYLH